MLGGKKNLDIFKCKLSLKFIVIKDKKSYQIAYMSSVLETELY